jgi:HSP20 family molecular chaperone IbpA
MFKQFENLFFNSIVDDFNDALSGIKKVEDKVTFPLNIIHETDGSSTVELAVVGKSREDIDVQGVIEDNKQFLVIKSIEKELTDEEKEAEAKRIYSAHKIKGTNNLYVKILVPARLNLKGAESKVSNGLLTVKIPAVEKKEPESIEFDIK